METAARVSAKSDLSWPGSGVWPQQRGLRSESATHSRRAGRRRSMGRQSRMGIYRPLSPNAEELLKTRYSLRNEAGDLTEDFPALVDRVAGALAGAEGRPVDVLSCPDAIARAIGMSLDECAEGPVRSTPLDVCPACGGPREPGRCGVCLSCWRGGCEGEVREGVHARDENC